MKRFLILVGAVAGITAGIIAFPSSAATAAGCRLPITAVIDGDSFKVRTECLPPSPPADLTLVRLAGIDTPELRGKCERERQWAAAARGFVTDLILWAERIELRQVGVEKFGRPLVEIYLDGVNLADQLVSVGLARRYDGRRPRSSWCVPATE